MINISTKQYSFGLVGNLCKEFLNDQAIYSKKIKWVHSLSAGVDNYLMAKDFAAAEHIPLTNSKGCFSRGLAEYVAFGILWHSKKLNLFQEQQQAQLWKPQIIELVNLRNVVIVGFGDIGACIGKILRNGFGAKVIGIKNRPDIISEEHKACADEIVGI